MRLISVLLAIIIHVFAAEAFQQTATISLQPVGSDSHRVTKLASITFDKFSLDTELSNYETPILSELSSAGEASEIEYLRVGLYDEATSSWASSTTLTSVNTFAKGYSPTFVISFDRNGKIMGVSVKAHRIDAGQTRDFGPKIKVVQMMREPKPSLNRPVVLKERTAEELVPEKSFLQKYWWIILALMMVLMSSKSDSA